LQLLDDTPDPYFLPLSLEAGSVCFLEPSCSIWTVP
jgi:hypothetical protein